MVTIRLPTVLRRLANDQADVLVDASNIGEALQALARTHPGVGSQLLDAGRVRPFVRVFLGAQDMAALQGPLTPVGRTDVLRIVPAIAGGA